MVTQASSKSPSTEHRVVELKQCKRVRRTLRSYSFVCATPEYRLTLTLCVRGTMCGMCKSANNRQIIDSRQSDWKPTACHYRLVCLAGVQFQCVCCTLGAHYAIEWPESVNDTNSRTPPRTPTTTTSEVRTAQRVQASVSLFYMIIRRLLDRAGGGVGGGVLLIGVRCGMRGIGNWPYTYYVYGYVVYICSRHVCVWLCASLRCCWSFASASRYSLLRVQKYNIHNNNSRHKLGAFVSGAKRANRNNLPYTITSYFFRSYDRTY